MIIKPCAMRGRIIGGGTSYVQQLEVNDADNANALTTATKDSMILEIKEGNMDVLNPMPDGSCRTIKQQYYKNSGANFLRSGSYAATGGVDIRMNENNVEYRIRKLTPLECWKLMGFSQEDYITARVGDREKAQELMVEYEPNQHLEMMQLVESKDMTKVSSTQLYKQAGNSIVVDVLYYIYKELYKAMPYLFENLKVGSYFSGIGAFEAGLDRLYDEIG